MRDEELRGFVKEIARILYGKMKKIDLKIDHLDSDIQDIKSDLSSIEMTLEDIKSTVDEIQNETRFGARRLSKKLEPWEPEPAKPKSKRKGKE